MMKNERIITHFQSYTTAEDCVKDLTPHFAGRISIVSPTEQKDPDNTAAEDAVQPGEEAADGDTLVERVAEVGGTAVGTLSYLIPGASSLVVGGPVAGAAIGAAVGGYLTGNMHDDVAGHPDLAKHEEYLVIVQTHGEKEADKVLKAVQRHGGTLRDRQEFGPPAVNIPAAVDAATTARAGNTVPDAYTATAHPNADTYTASYSNNTDSDAHVADFIEYGDADRTAITADVSPVEPPGDEVPDGYPQRVGEAMRRVPREDGYELDPIPPAYSNNHWVDPNIGYGSVENVDPAAGPALIEDREIK